MRGVHADLAIAGYLMLNLVLFSGILRDLDKVLGQTSLALGLLRYLVGEMQTIPFFAFYPSLSNSRVSPASEMLF